MRLFYFKFLFIPSTFLLSACEQQSSTATKNVESWPNAHEEIFQQAEVLKYSLQQDQLERQRLKNAGLPVLPPDIKGSH